ncbi:MAG TPA: hypothetical protein VMU95_40150 [Trebonia sp.]|nr:hypothetical protein [Trebonia sp.]
MGVFKNLRDLQKQAREIERNAPPVGERLAAAQERMAAVNQMMAMQTQAATAAARGTAVAGNCPVVITGMRQIGTVNFDLMVEFDLTVTPQGSAPYPATTQQLISQFQVSKLQVGSSLLATIDPSNPAAIWLDLASLR